MDGELVSKLDPSRLDDPQVAHLHGLRILLIDEFSMLDEVMYAKIADVFQQIRKGHTNEGTDAWGKMHLLMFGDLKQVCGFFLFHVEF